MASILIADDDGVFGKTLEQFLSALGHVPYRVLDAQELAAAVLKRKFDLVIMDMQMPAGGAPAALKCLESKLETARLPVIGVSGMPVEQMKRWFPERENVRLLHKPVRLPEVKAALEELLGS